MRFKGGDVNPEKVSLGTLSQTLAAIGRLAVGEAGPPRRDDEEVADPGPFQLVGVRRGSALYSFNGGYRPDAIERLRVVGQTLRDPDAATEADFSLRAIQDLSAVAARLKCQIVISTPTEGVTGVLARIGPGSARTLRDSLLIEGDTSLYGKIERVGGATKIGCSLRISSQDSLVYCRVASQSLSRRLGKLLYHDVQLHGRATWIRSNWRVVRFHIHGVDRLLDETPSESFQKIREAGASDWDDIGDPEDFLGHDGRDG